MKSATDGRNKGTPGSRTRSAAEGEHRTGEDVARANPCAGWLMRYASNRAAPECSSTTSGQTNAADRWDTRQRQQAPGEALAIAARNARLIEGERSAQEHKSSIIWREHLARSVDAAALPQNVRLLESAPQRQGHAVSESSDAWAAPVFLCCIAESPNLRSAEDDRQHEKPRRSNRPSMAAPGMHRRIRSASAMPPGHRPRSLRTCGHQHRAARTGRGCAGCERLVLGACAVFIGFTREKSIRASSAERRQTEHRLTPIEPVRAAHGFPYAAPLPG